MEIIVILIIIGIVFYIHRHEDKLDSKRKTTKCIRFVEAIENDHFLYPLTPESKDWVIEHKYREWHQFKHRIPEDVKRHFISFQFEN